MFLGIFILELATCLLCVQSEEVHEIEVDNFTVFGSDDYLSDDHIFDDWLNSDSWNGEFNTADRSSADTADTGDTQLKDLTVNDLINIKERTEKIYYNYYLRGQKKENPQTRLYKNRTIEVGIFLDKYLWREVKDVLWDTNRREREAHLLAGLHSLLVDTQTILQGQSISSMGGFNIALNGLDIWKYDENDEIAKIHQSRDTSQMLNSFKKFAEVYNDPYDGNENSYDVMILLSGAHKNLGMPRSSNQGLAFIDTVCDQSFNTLVMTASYAGGQFSRLFAVMLAHEIGHLLGALHDHEVGCDHYTNQIMAATGTWYRSGWSQCSREKIDKSYRERERKNPRRGNCFYT